MIVYKLFIGLIIAVAVGWVFHNRCRDEDDLRACNLKPGHKTVLVDPLLLPLCLVVLLAIFLFRNGFAFTGTLMARLCAILFLYISIYFAFLLCLLPLLRRFVSARACATLWLLPNLLYMTIYTANTEMNPLLVITLPRRWLVLFTWVWLTGFVCVLLWQIISHLHFRRSLLQNAMPVTDERILSQWAYEQKRGGVRRPFPLLTSADIDTPVSVGLFDRTLRLVLPTQRYEEKELTLIFRHELRHIQRLDIKTKAFLGFCAAMCWFNPLMWIARRRASDDLELSCDEAVLAGADENTRQLYAELLLNTAGSCKGYTTCLSASANSLRYRLKNVVKPQRRYTGVAAISIAMLVLIMSYGTVALADSGGTVQTLILDKAPSSSVIKSIFIYNNWPDGLVGYRSVYGWNEDALTAYLASLHVRQVYVGSYSDEGLRQFHVDYGIPEGESYGGLTRLELCDGLIWANIPYDDYGNLVYILEDEVDWDYIESLLDWGAPNPDPAPYPPEMMMYFNDDINADGKLMQASKTILSIRRGGEEQAINAILNTDGTGGIYGFPVTEVQLTFSYAPLDGYEVQVEDWERTKSYFVSSDDLSENVLPLAPYSAHYTVYRTFATVRETIYEMKYTFDVELPDE